MPSASVCLIAKLEGRYLLEWIAYYLCLGFDRILIYDNNDEDDGTLALIQQCQSQDSRIEYIPWPRIQGKVPQQTAYADALARATTEWMAFFDADEYLVLNRANTIGEFLSGIPAEVSGLAINWRIFGSSGRQHYHPDLVIRRFQLCSSPKFRGLHTLHKSILRVARVKKIVVHHADFDTGSYADSLGKQVAVKGARVARAEFGGAQLNHYVNKSLDEFLVKKMRTRATRLTGARDMFHRDEKHWHSLDRNEVRDVAILKMIPAVEAKMRDLVGEVWANRFLQEENEDSAEGLPRVEYMAR